MYLSTTYILHRSIANVRFLDGGKYWTSRFQTYRTAQSYTINHRNIQSRTKSTTTTTTSKAEGRINISRNPITNKSEMRIATLQFAPQLGDVEGNIKRADRLLKLIPPNANDGYAFDDEEEPGIEELRPDILVLPEMAFSGYNFPSLEAIRPYLEVQGHGPSAQWARRTAQRLKCKVCVGYPEIYQPDASSADGNNENENGSGLVANSAKMYNSLLVVDEAGEVIHNYRKRFLYYTDESWASEGEAEWSFKFLEFQPVMFDADTTSLLPESSRNPIQIPTTFGICMDINPYKFEAPFDAWEFAYRVLNSQSHLVIISAAWLVNDATSIMGKPSQLPDMDTFNYWIRRFWPLLEKKINYGDKQLNGFSSSTETKVIIVFANRTGVEDGGPGCLIPIATYAGTSTVVAITQKHESSSLDVKIHCWGIKGSREEGICFADTESEPKMTFVTKRSDDPSD
ncbi:asparagine amidohydrolase, putative [Talaromyces stipitatus ATCC 10500]|uniref:Asparagine amidohydrolase, putative n=1 Tax=Talaromyces stipitatus (strain ATCC 10500 / CBS 375.48 / QM 6759 / NRRL 1006) TaxID=441959 RepID=B8M9X0_TALSN|nr:asparagine amidohydrolase, putative [Talaromyces stipitatus ATCC 10500]EED18122.1 asparagine amidohydrolase, putative [Talaromyces stipitatus ATCC 10500]